MGNNEYELHGAQPLYRDAHQTRVGEGIPRRTMYVVLERASMELCRAPPATHGRQAKQKPTLLTCDDHQGLLVRMGREVSDARPDITHQVGQSIAKAARRSRQRLCAIVPPHAARLASEQGRPAQDIYPHDAGSAHRGAPRRPDSTHVQTLQRPHGFVEQADARSLSDIDFLI